MSTILRPWLDGDEAAVDSLLDPDSDALWRSQGHGLHGHDRDGAAWRRTVVALKSDVVVGVGTVARNRVHAGRYSVAVEVAAGQRRHGLGTLLLNAVRDLRPEPLPLAGKVRERDTASLGFTQSCGALRYQRCPCPTVDPRAAVAALAADDPGAGAVRPLVGCDPDVPLSAFTDIYRWVHEPWSPVTDDAALAVAAASAVSDADLALSHGCWQGPSLAAVAFAFRDVDHLDITAETVTRHQLGGHAALRAALAATMAARGERRHRGGRIRRTRRRSTPIATSARPPDRPIRPTATGRTSLGRRTGHAGAAEAGPGLRTRHCSTTKPLRRQARLITMWTVSRAVVLVMVVGAVGGCGGSGGSLTPRAAGADTSAVCPSVFVLSLVSDHGGQPTPLAAARWFARHGNVAGIPVSGWHIADVSSGSAIAQSGRSTVHVTQGSDRAWQVDNGHNCG